MTFGGTHSVSNSIGWLSITDVYRDISQLERVRQVAYSCVYSFSTGSTRCRPSGSPGCSALRVLHGVKQQESGADYREDRAAQEGKMGRK